ncbi:hypothetical protein B0H21DRAFT_823362 [Amylocystis lapponica]|nr:hypothetical protein B0H21DRAFT_823362 [Amylocystis lapponica]
MRYMLLIFFEIAAEVRRFACPLRRYHGRFRSSGRYHGLGYSLEPLTEDVQEDDFAAAAKVFFPTLFGLGMLHISMGFVYKLSPESVRRRIVKPVPSAPVQKFKNIIDTVGNKSDTIYRAKKRVLGQDDEAVMRQVGHHFAERIAARNGEDLPYNALVQPSYLAAVCRKTLRASVPPLPFRSLLSPHASQAPLSGHGSLTQLRGLSPRSDRTRTHIRLPSTRKDVIMLLSTGGWFSRSCCGAARRSPRTSRVPGVSDARHPVQSSAESAPHALRGGLEYRS